MSKKVSNNFERYQISVEQSLRLERQLYLGVIFICLYLILYLIIFGRFAQAISILTSSKFIMHKFQCYGFLSSSKICYILSLTGPKCAFKLERLYLFVTKFVSYSWSTNQDHKCSQYLTVSAFKIAHTFCCHEIGQQIQEVSRKSLAIVCLSVSL